jgi:hypothetical protein
MSAGYMPVYQLLCQAGGKLPTTISAPSSPSAACRKPRGCRLGQWSPRLDNVLADAARKRRCRAGLASAQAPAAAPEAQVNFHWPIFPHPKGKDFVDFDEDLQVRDIVNATRIGYRDVQLVKRYSTVGMGPPRAPLGAANRAPGGRATQRSISETGVTTARPPFVAEKLAHVAGRAFDPYRQTPMHRRHVEAGAKMMPAGIWQRPAYYGTARDRDACMQAEALHVRNKVGIIDVSTLGGLDVRGPDAAELLNRMYTFAFSSSRGSLALCADDQRTWGGDRRRRVRALCREPLLRHRHHQRRRPHLSADAQVERAMAPGRRHRQRHRRHFGGQRSRAGLTQGAGESLRGSGSVRRRFLTWAFAWARWPGSRHGSCASASSANWVMKSTYPRVMR